MTIKFDMSHELKVTNFSLRSKIFGTKWIEWENESLTQKIFVYGTKLIIKLTCIETDIDWDNSDVKYLMEKQESGNPISLIISDEPALPTISSVGFYVTDVQFSYSTDKAGHNIRTFTVTLEEV